ncbi:DNA damage-inducible protein I, partial [Salmonella enterica subsp. enterica serovar Typhimurium]|nr:DNA damage-inducible protein I [Salmonella enterica]EBV9142978.1 DNA damage-inducible protein I [Salmonella enterica subsp. enterica serovar Typhimurium var. 5-]ECN7194330.1 DNA damage-inducible protein I [Salmonella enterica subsp. enterica serovar Typhimurium]EDN4514174.1 DNA damage-inducible protein I [Salmonella enterica subsp. enterica serovar 4,[5],12:i:-]EBP5454790.1 DNA damage-inducible protein I [Salmonella enterica]
MLLYTGFNCIYIQYIQQGAIMRI